MFDIDRKWPLGAARIGFPIYLAVLTTILLALLALDYPIASWARADLVSTRPFFEIVTIPGDSAWTLVPALVVCVVALVLWRLFRTPRRKTQAKTVAMLAGFVFVGVAVPGLISNLIKRLVGRARPVHLDDLGTLSFHPLQDWSFQSFPSGDTTTVFAAAAIVLFFFPRLGWLAVAGAALVGFARIALGVHFPSDVYGGFLLGTFGAYAVRNFYLRQGWLFRHAGGGRIVPDLRWS